MFFFSLNILTDTPFFGSWVCCKNPKTNTFTCGNSSDEPKLLTFPFYYYFNLFVFALEKHSNPIGWLTGKFCVYAVHCFCALFGLKHKTTVQLLLLADPTTTTTTFVSLWLIDWVWHLRKRRLKYSENSIYNIFNSLTCRVFGIGFCYVFVFLFRGAHHNVWEHLSVANNTRARSNFNGWLTNRHPNYTFSTPHSQYTEKRT